jgi:hypothetical protein
MFCRTDIAWRAFAGADAATNADAGASGKA